MQKNMKNGKIISTMVLFLLLCVALLWKDWKKPADMVKQEATPTLTPTPAGPVELSNVWLVEACGNEVRVLCGGQEVCYRSASPLQNAISSCIVDLTVEKNVVTGLVVQRDTIEAKVLRVGADFVELEGYGVLELEEDSRVYRMYDGISEVSWADVLVGYTTSAFVLAENKVSAALIQEPVEVTAIRVLIQTSSYGGYYHDTLECGSENGFYVSDGQGKTEWLEGGKRVEITPELVREYGGRMYLGTDSEEGRIALYNVRRAAGIPSYRGTLELALSEGKLLVVNELPLEEYLYGVLPSEMPESFGAEALKAQAVCARSYACNQLLANRYSAYGAHVDDSMNCQVYQNYGETEASVEAVKATFGRVLSREGKCITAYYFSCSYGHTSDSYAVWGDDTGTRFQGVVQATESSAGNLAKNSDFEQFLDSDREWYDEESVWFRWSTVLGTELNERILLRLRERQAAVPDMILRKVSQNGDEMRFEQGEADRFGTLQDIIIAERSDSGLVTKLVLVGSEATYLVQKEYNIRYVLAPMNVVYLKDGSTTSNMNLLPSGYFTVEKGPNFFSVRGGGHGHGAGMSQYGAKYLAANGKSFEDILRHYYRDTDITYLYR
ncbi:MAG: SpoIID/LytB domain-containing protein [Lachnospiraceae bacterium]|nr:SpoIID/LytB domain-containing protein [Lachnospiraceae bacterium]